MYKLISSFLPTQNSSFFLIFILLGPKSPLQTIPEGTHILARNDPQQCLYDKRNPSPYRGVKIAWELPVPYQLDFFLLWLAPSQYSAVVALQVCHFYCGMAKNRNRSADVFHVPLQGPIVREPYNGLVQATNNRSSENGRELCGDC